jgi:hypothetical protein
MFLPQKILEQVHGNLKGPGRWPWPLEYPIFLAPTILGQVLVNPLPYPQSKSRQLEHA